MRPPLPVSATAVRSGASMPISSEVMARMRSSSVIIFSRVSERTRAISTTSDTGLVRKAAANLKAVHVGHHDVEQDDVAFGARADIQRLGAIRRGQHIEIFGRQPGFQQLDVGGNVIDDQDTRRHRNSLLLPNKTPYCFNKLADRNWL